jgi:nucleotide-binding universal stress UspA family protein
MKNILLLVHSDDGQESRLQCALDVVRAVDGHLTCLDVVSPPVVVAEFDAGYTQGVLAEDAVAAERELRAALEPRLQREGVPYSWIETTGDIRECIFDQAGLSDLVVVGAHPDKGEFTHGDIAADIAGKIGTAILAVPHAAKSIVLFGTAVVAWDGSEAADAALRAAMPLLAQAKETIIVTVGAVDGDPKEAAQYCSRHGIEPEIHEAPAIGWASEVLLDRSEVFGAGYVVMGAFGHSRVREAIFGGVTRAMLSRSKRPLLLAS